MDAESSCCTMQSTLILKALNELEFGNSLTWYPYLYMNVFVCILHSLKIYTLLNGKTLGAFLLFSGEKSRMIVVITAIL